MATVNALYAIISLNFRYLVRQKTKDFGLRLYDMAGYYSINILLPTDVIEIIDDDLDDDWIHKVRVDIYEKTKNMFKDELQEYFRKSGEEIAKKYVFTILDPLSSNDND
jgi:hypothetical protein